MGGVGAQSRAPPRTFPPAAPRPPRRPWHARRGIVRVIVAESLELSADELSWEPPPLPPADDVSPARTTLGQDRAVGALQFGLRLRAPGYHIYVAGPTGTGRASTLMRLLDELKKESCPTLRDLVYVHRFSDPSRPRLLQFPPGGARTFTRDFHHALGHVREHVSTILEDESVRRDRDRIHAEARRAQQTLMGPFEVRLREASLALVELKAGPLLVPQIFPVIRGATTPWEEAEKLVADGKFKPEQLDRLREDGERLREELTEIIRRLAHITQQTTEALRELEATAVGRMLDALFGELLSRYPGDDKEEYLAEVRDAIVEDPESFKRSGRRGNGDLDAVLGEGRPLDPMERFGVNLLLDSASREPCPVVVEDSPSFTNLLGAIEFDMPARGGPHASFRQIKAGSLLRADGGFLVVEASELLMSPGSWWQLKRVLKTGRLEIGVPDWPLLWGGVALKPEAIEPDVKVILIGDARLYALLHELDEDFRKIFKIKAEFDGEMEVNGETVGHCLSVLAKVREDEKLLPFDATGSRAIVREMVRRSGRRDRLSAKFGDMADIAREASAWAGRDGGRVVGAAHVRRAVEEADRRHDLPDEKVQEMIDSGRISIETAGARVGQVNGLSVYDLGTYVFGKPVRITASASMGRSGLISIEREAGLSGRIHNKGMLIVAGLLRSRYAVRAPLSLSASLCFEQSYGGVEGDSASSAEVFALLSALAGVPIRQAIAVTGSVDQAGRIQTVGGIPEKIEGFFRTCKRRGLTGEQGVVVPAANRGDLVLRDDVVEAVRGGEFHVWAIETVDQGMELLTGETAGARRADGGYEPGTVNYKVMHRLNEFADALARFGPGT